MKILKRLFGENDFSYVMFHSLLALLVRGGAALSGFLLNLVIVKSLQPSIAGELFILLSIVTALGQISTLGLGNAILKHMGAAKGRADNLYLNQFFSNSLYLASFVSTIVILLLYLISEYTLLVFFDSNFDIKLLHLMSLAIPVVTIFSIFMSSFQSVGKSVTGLFFQSVCQPLLFCAICLLFVNNIYDAVLAYLLSCFLTLPFVFYYWNKLAFTQFLGLSLKFLTLIKNNGASFFFIIVVGMLLNQAPILVGAALVASEDVALISIALKVSGLISFILVACNMVLSPTFSHLHATGNKKMLALYARKGTAFMMVFASPLLFVLIFFPDVVLNIFGQEYTRARTILIILSLGQFINVVTGSVGALLMMTGYQKAFNRMQVLNLLAFIVIVSVGQKSVIGMHIIAIAVLVGSSIQNIGAFILVRYRLGFHTFPFLSIKQSN